MADEPAPMPSLKARIAALNIQDVGKAPPTPPPAYGHGAATKKRPPPPPANPPPRLAEEARTQSVNNPPLQSHAPTTARTIGNQPADATNQPKRILPPPSLGSANDAAPARPTLPPRPWRSSQHGPALPPRRPSEQSIQRKESQESISTIASGRSVGSALSGRTSVTSGTTHGEVQASRVKAPLFDPSKLPPLPPKKTKEEKDAELMKHDPVRAKYLARTNSSTAQPSQTPQPPSLPTRPSLPSRPNTTQNGSAVTRNPRRSALEWGLNKSTETAPALPASRPGQPVASEPPPIPLSSRPDLSALQASKPKPSAQTSCLKCRDFRAVDSHAARFPREAIPSQDLSWLAHQLTDPFPSLTDKARALFTWLHHNIDYNTAAFFSNNVKPSTPASTIATGLAVCEGYAGLFTALAGKIGLESVVIGGHGKGYGYAPLKPGDPIPPFSCGHAWNAVRIDGGEWKLIDCCWGAGNVEGNSQSYSRHFKPEFFYMDNNEFGLKHFPEDARYFFRTDGRATIPWEEYIAAPPTANVYGFAAAAGLNERSFQPAVRSIRIHDPDPHAPRVIRFQFEKRCAHYDGVALGDGAPYMYFLTTEGRDGKNKQFLPFETDGRFWWLDVERLELGNPGQSVMACVGDKWEGGPEGSGRGVTRQMWERNRYAFRWYNGVASWELS